MVKCATLALSLEFVPLCLAVQGNSVTSLQMTSLELNFNSCTRGGLGYGVIRFICREQSESIYP